MFIFKYAQKKHYILALANLLIVTGLVVLLPGASPITHIIVAVSHMLFNAIVLLRIRAGTSELKKQLPILSNPGAKTFNDFFQHIVFPLFELLAFWAALYFLELDVIKWGLVLIQSYAFLTLLENLEAFKSNFHLIERHTHFIYDLLTVLTGFLLFYSLFGIKEYWDLNPILIGFIGFLLAMGLLKQDIDRYGYHKKLKLFLVMAFVTLVLIIGLMVLQLGNTRVAFIMAFTQYLILSYLNHNAKEHKLSLGIIIEYSLLVAIIAVILSQINI